MPRELESRIFSQRNEKYVSLTMVRKSITNVFGAYMENKDRLAEIGVNSFAAFVTLIVNTMIKHYKVSDIIDMYYNMDFLNEQFLLKNRNERESQEKYFNTIEKKFTKDFDKKAKDREEIIMSTKIPKG